MKDASLSPGGYIRLYRSLLSWQWFQDSATLHVFICLLLTACFKPLSHAGVDLAPGQLIISRSRLCALTGLSERRVRTALSHLKQTGEIAILARHDFSIVTITHFARWQGLACPASAPATGQRETSSRPDKKNDNHVNQEKKKGDFPHDHKGCYQGLGTTL